MIYIVKNIRTKRTVNRFTQHTAAIEFAQFVLALGVVFGIYEGDVESPTWLVYDGTIYVKQTTKK